MEAQSYRMSFDEIPSVKYIANYVGRQQQLFAFFPCIERRYTQRGGRRPFGVCTFICGMDGEKGRLFTTDPAGIVVEWKVMFMKSVHRRPTRAVATKQPFALSSSRTIRRT